MAYKFPATVSKTLFVGREAELELFDQVLQSQRRERILHFPGPGGTGKTRLLEEMRERVATQPDVLVTADLIDFYKTANQTGFGLLDDVARQLGAQRFQTFHQEREQFRELLLREPEPGERGEAVHRVTEAFLKDYHALQTQGLRVVLLFDTCEEMHGVEDWFLGTLLPGILMRTQVHQPPADGVREAEIDIIEDDLHTTVVIAGRKRLDFPAEVGDLVRVADLEALSEAEVREFFRKGKLDEAIVSDEQIGELRIRSGGRPLYVALSFDWIKNEVGTVEQLLAPHIAEHDIAKEASDDQAGVFELEAPFAARLVVWVQRLPSAERRAILYTALAWRRMEPSLLSRLLYEGKDEEERIEQARLLIERLSRFSFVKYRPSSEDFLGSFQLHDEMRDLVRRYVWPQEGAMTQQALLIQVIAWYEERIGRAELLAGEALPADDEERALVAEWLFYQAQLDLAQAFGHHERLFRYASHYLDLAFCEMLNQEMRRFSRTLSLQQQDELSYRDALVAFRREQYASAYKLWVSLLRRPDLNLKLRATTLMMLTELSGYTGRPEVGIEYAQDGEHLYQELIAAEADPSEREQLRVELGQLYNNRGYCYRVKGEFANALSDYDQALQMPGRPKNEARTLNNIGFIYFLQGNFTEARTHVGRALQIREDLGIDYELGLGYNTMGQIMEESGRTDEAADLYRKALERFRVARSERGQALVLLNQGRLERVVNDYEEAISNLEAARKVFEKLGDKDNLAHALNELGCVYRQRGETDDWQKGLAHLEASRQLSEELGRPRDLADNIEDLAILHYRWAREARHQGDTEAVREHATQAHAYARQAHELAREYRIIYLQAKNERTFGDLAYDEGAYDEAFDHYFAACRSMARAVGERKGSPVLLQRRYEQMVDRLQERLQSFPSVEETQRQVERLLRQLQVLNEQEREQLSTLQEFLEASNRLALRAKSFHKATR
ncbi:MAG: tetratricopeptide repeat protein [Anaerolineae bacterium]